MKKVSKGDIVLEDGVLYTIEEHEKAQKETEALDKLEALFKEKGMLSDKKH